MKTPEQTVRYYLSLIPAQDFENMPLHEMVRHESPYGEVLGRRVFTEACRSLVAGTREIVIKSCIAQGDTVAVEYEAIKDTGSRFELSEWFRIVDGKIVEIKAFFDGSRFNA